ncbi:2,3,4,5-tetrahydropyridine-2,6-dicarboxylate N-succinyltransferase [bacterium]|nr:2,3,4,5-tetrahydropyridine-2,6-dicarboxylate N-succinyltransferase [bacterium]
MNKELISQAFADRSLLESARQDICEAIDLLDKGQIRVAEKENGVWKVNTWVKEAVILYFAINKMQTWETPPFEYYDKIPLKSNLAKAGVRAVPPGTARFGAYMAPGTILMVGYVNIGAYIDSGTMVDTWALVGSCAQIGKNVHIAAGTIIGGVLEPANASPVIIEDNCFIGSKCSIVEGVIVEEGAVLGSGVNITASTHIIDVTGPEPVEYKGRVPAYSVVIPGTRPRKFAAGVYNVPCALIIGRRDASTDAKTGLNNVLREFGEVL